MSASRSEPPNGPLRGDSEGVSEVIGQVLIFAIVSFLLVASMLAFNLAQDAARIRVIGLRAESAAARVSGVVVQAAFVQERQATTPGATAQGKFLVDLPQQFEGLAYSVRLVPGRTVNDGATGGFTLTSATAQFTASDIGNGVSGGSIPAGATITAVASATQATISASAPAATGLAVNIGSVTCNQQVPAAAAVEVSAPSVAVCVNSALFSADAPTGIAVCKSTAAGGHLYVRYAIPSPAIAGCAGGGSFLFLESAP